MGSPTDAPANGLAKVVVTGGLSIQDPDPPSPARLRVAVIGLGYVGLATALSFIDGGASVMGIDISRDRLQAIRRQRVDLQPEDLKRLAAALALPQFQLSSESVALEGADAIIVCVPTPVDEHRTPDLSALRVACATVVHQAHAGQTLILTSTSYVGTTRELLAEPIAERGLTVGEDVFVAFSPERIDPGSLGHSSVMVPRVVGGMTLACTVEATKVLGLAASELHPVKSPEVAELTMLHENIFRAVNLALVNEMAEIAGTLGLDILEVIEAASTKPYGFMRFTPGPGVGGYCIPCDPHYLLWQLRSMQKDAPVLEQAMRSIALRPGRVVERALEVLADHGRSAHGAHVLIVGVAYKPGIEDVRESPAIEIASQLAGLGAEVAFTDPLVRSMRLRSGTVLESVGTDSGPYDLAIVHTLHPEMATDWLMHVPAVLDATYTLRRMVHVVFV